MKLLRPLRRRDFALLWTGMTVSLLGDGIFIAAEAWQVYDIENGPVALSLVGAGVDGWTGSSASASDRSPSRSPGPVSQAIGTDARLVLAGLLPMVVCAVLYVAAGLRRDEDLHPLLGDDYAVGAGAASADSVSGTPAMS